VLDLASFVYILTLYIMVVLKFTFHSFQFEKSLTESFMKIIFKLWILKWVSWIESF